MEQIPEPGGRALLLQTVALFETLLGRIQSMQGEAKVLEAERDQLTLGETWFACLYSSLILTSP